MRKQRSAGNPFEDRVTIDAKYLKEKGINASVTYARGEDKDPDAYEYQSQWSLRGGRLPENPRVGEGELGGRHARRRRSCRARSRSKATSTAMKASGITRVTVQIHYPKFGEEVEENIHISPAKNEALIAKPIFMDRSARGYAYRLV